MNILLLTDSYPPEIRSAAVLMQELAEGLAARGHDVSVCTLRPRYNLAGNAKGNGNAAGMATENGVRVIRVNSLPVHNAPLWLRGLGELTLPWVFLRGLTSVPHPDVISIYSPPLPLGLAGAALKVFRRAPFILNVQDLFPQHIIDVGLLKNPALIHGYRTMERLLYQAAEKIAVHSQGNKRFLVQQRRVPAHKIALLPNWVDTEQPTGAASLNFRETWKLGNKFMLVFGGVMGHTQGLGVVVAAAEKLQKCRDIVFLMVGDGVAKAGLEAQVQQKRLANVLFKPFVKPADYRSLLAEVDAGFLTLSPEVRTPVVPSKLLGYMAAGKPYVAALNPESDAVAITHDSGAGLCVPAGDAQAFAQAVQTLYADQDRGRAMGRRGREYAQAHFSKEVCLARYEALLLSCARAGAPRPEPAAGSPAVPVFSCAKNSPDLGAVI